MEPLFHGYRLCPAVICITSWFMLHLMCAPITNAEYCTRDGTCDMQCIYGTIPESVLRQARSKLQRYEIYVVLDHWLIPRRAFRDDLSRIKTAMTETKLSADK